jgi:signal transduction histidine kinase
MVIGSLILPGYLIKTICGAVISVYAILIALQHEQLITSHRIEGLYVSFPVHTESYYILFILVFAAMMIITVLITNRMARNLLQREEQLRKTLNELNEAEAAKQKYIMGVVHEIKSPVSAVRSIIDLILGDMVGPISDQLKQKLVRAKNRTDQALELINDIVKISKLKLLSSTEQSTIYLSDLIREYVEEHTDDLKSKNIYVEIEDFRDSRIPILGDKDLIELAISNLLSNAAKYVDENGRVRIEIDEYQRNLRLRLMDNGIGIPREDLKNIFQQFYRASNIKKRRSEGTGLGLSLVQEIIHHHKGVILVDSPSEIGEENKPGTCFTIILPYAFEELEKHEASLKPLEGGL